MGTIAVHWGWLDTVPGFPDRLRENPPRQGFFEHPEYLAVRAHLPAPWQDILDLAYYSGWRKNEILGLTWDEIDEAGGVIRLSPARSKTLVGRILPISHPIAEALARRRARRDPTSPLVFHRDGIPIRRWRTAWRTACQAAGVPTRFLHDCRRTAARNLIRASVAERVAMLLTGHKSRAIFDRYNIIHEQELLEAGDQLVEYLAQHAQATPRGGRPHPARTHRAAPSPRATHHRVRAGVRPPGTGSPPRAEGPRVAGHRPSVRRDSRPGHTTGRPAVAAHAATGRADAADHGHVPDGSASATRGWASVRSTSRSHGAPSRTSSMSSRGGWSAAYRQNVDVGTASYTRGIQIVRQSRPSAEIFSRMKRESHGTAQYVDFVAHDWRNGRVSTISTDPCATTNYFQTDNNSLPFELSPAFFKPEVLSKYKNDTDKYLIEDCHIHCRSAWELRGYDVNEAGQVHAYICDLRNLPYSEQLYWKSFNEEPQTGISERALTTDFKGEPVDITDPLTKIKYILTRWEQSKAPWWILRDPAAADRVTSPLTSSRDEWARASTNLVQLIIEGFEIKAVRTRLDEMGIAWHLKDKSILLLERVLSSEAADGSAQNLDGLRSLQRIRSKVGAHARGTEADSLATRAVQEYGSYAAHFENVCRDVAIELEYIERAFSQGSRQALSS